nr:DUF2946 family protein [Pseudoxanthomonas sp.]
MRYMTRLAVLAALLIALAPSISRVLGSRGGEPLAGWAELCTPAGLTWVDIAAAKARETAPASGWPDEGDACPQCPLAATMPPPPDAFRLPLPWLPPTANPESEAPLPAQGTPPAGPGCRGPPSV